MIWAIWQRMTRNAFEKPAKNVVYNIPETKPIMEPAITEALHVEPKPEPSEQQKIEKSSG